MVDDVILESVEKGMANKYRWFYPGDDLGVNYTREKTIFRVWTPVADDLQLLLYNHEDDPHPQQIINFEPDVRGTWKAEVDGDLEGMYYLYKVFIDGETNYVVDPYTKAVGTNSRRGLIIDLEKTNPPGWENDSRVTLEQPQDAIIYEMHVRDFSIAKNSGMFNKGKYLAFTEEDTVGPEGIKTGLAHLKELGVTHVHLLPVFDFGSVDDTNPRDYNWGYDPVFYNTPEGSYATNPADDSRIRELKMLIQTLHKNGIGVIMDVVYNHTYQTENSPFNLLVPGYYYRLDDNGNFSNGSGTGNETASEKPMFRKFMVDSVRYWAEEYHIDGFRFDLMALHDKETIKEIEETLHQIDPSILIYGEPWMGGLSPLDPDKQMVKGAQQDMNVAVFNDNFRNAIKGDNDGTKRGFVSGDGFQVDNIKRGIVGSIKYSKELQDFAKEPWETINYVSSHDNLTLWDKLKKSNPKDCEEIRIRMDRLAQTIIFTSQGIPFFLGGEEMLRTKKGVHNSYNAGDEINKIDWERKIKYHETFEFYKGLIELRKKHPAFRMRNAKQIKKHLKFLKTPPNTVGFWLKDHANNDSWRHIVVLHNANRTMTKFELPINGKWYVVVSHEVAGCTPISAFHEKEVELSPISSLVLFKK